MRLCTCLALVAGGAKAIDEDFELLDVILLVLVGGFELGAALGLLRPGTFRSCRCRKWTRLVPDLSNLFDGDVEKVAVVRDQDVGECGSC